MAKRVIVLGGGISGLSLAWKLAENGIDVDVIEKNDYVGGLSATIIEDGRKMDFGPHSLFSEDEQILSTIKGLFEADGIRTGIRDVRLYMRGQYLRYPLKAEDILLKLGLTPSAKCFISFILERFKTLPPVGPHGPNMEQWSVHQFGRALHEIFFKPYTEQFWDVSCSELSPSCIPTYKQMSFTKTLKLLMTPKKRRQNYSMIDREVLPLYYPRDGFGSIPEKIAERVIDLKGSVNTSLEVIETRILNNGGFVAKTRNKDGESREFAGDYIVSTIPIKDFARTIRPAPKADILRAANELQYLSLMVLYLATDKKELLDSMYEYCLGRPYNRITDVNRFTLVPERDKNGNMLSIEQSCHLNDKHWKSTKEELFKEYIPHLEREGILKESEVTGVHLMRASHAYPMYRYGYIDPYRAFKDYCASVKGMTLCGRTGAFIYMDIDQCMKLSFELAERIAREK